MTTEPTMTGYPAKVLIARGNSASGYRGVVLLTYAPGTAHEYTLATCDHLHASTFEARACARWLAGWWSRHPFATDAQLAARYHEEAE